MARPLLGLFLWLVAANPAFALDFSHYHSQSDISFFLHTLAVQHADVVHLQKLGNSELGREISYVVISQGDVETLPAIYLNGTHHGDEKASTETVLGVIDYLVKHRRNPEVHELLTNYAIYLQPLVNPDGHALNTRFDAHGIDPNRDYSYPGRTDEESFKTPQVRLVKELTSKVHFRAALAFHSGMEGVLWAWAYTPERSVDQDLYYTLAKSTALAMGMTKYGQSYLDYPSQGEFIDYVYATYGTLALTVEVANDPTPDSRLLPATVQRAVGGAMAFMLDILELDRGELRIERAPGLGPVALGSRTTAAKRDQRGSP